jgi:hypothetical protein
VKRRSFLTLPVAAGIAGLGAPNRAEASLVPPFFLDCVVALGFSGPGMRDGAAVPEVWHTVGTGFFYGRLAKDDPDPRKKQYHVFLVTAKHVVDDFRKLTAGNPAIHGVNVRVNPMDSQSVGAEFWIPLLDDKGNSTWVNNPYGRDISVVRINGKVLIEKNDQFAFFTSDSVLSVDKMRSLGISAGDGVFVLGFPMDMAGTQKNYVIIREGIIARISEMLDKASNSFLIDSLIFPGNSGGPVVLRPEVVSVTGTQTYGSAALIGVAVSVVNYTDSAASLQTGRTRITFEENSGLANVLPTDYIDEAVEAAVAAQAPPAPG